MSALGSSCRRSIGLLCILAALGVMLLLPAAASAEALDHLDVTVGQLHDSVPAASDTRIAWWRADVGANGVWTDRPGEGAHRIWTGFDVVSIQVSGERVAWLGRETDLSPYRIYTWTFTGGLETVAAAVLGSTQYDLSGDRLVWAQDSDAGILGDEIYTWAEGATSKVSGNIQFNDSPQVDGNLVGWRGGDTAGTPDFDVYASVIGGSGPTQLSSTPSPEGFTGIEMYVAVGGGVVAWVSEDSQYVWRWDGEVTSSVSASWAEGLVASSSGRLAWLDNYDVITWSASNPGPEPPLTATMSETGVRISGDRIAWIELGESSSIYTWSPDGGLTQVLNSSTLNGSPAVSPNSVVWAELSGGYSTISREGSSYGILPPVGATDSYTVAPGMVLDVLAPGLLANDYSPSWRTLHAESASLTVNSDGSFSYQAPETQGMQYLSYYSSDDLGNRVLITVNINVYEQNSPPTAVDDSYTTAEDTVLYRDPGVLHNDTDPDHDILYMTSATQPAHGSLVWNSNGTFTYTPDPNYFGPDSFTYTIEDRHGVAAAAPATSYITVQPMPDNPVPVDDHFGTQAGQQLSVAAPGVLLNDSDPDGDQLSVQSWTQGANGSVSFQSNGALVYTPNPGFEGRDYFSYTVSDGTGRTATTSVAVTVAEYEQFENGQITSSAASDHDVVATPARVSWIRTTADNGSVFTWTKDKGTRAVSGTGSALKLRGSGERLVWLSSVGGGMYELVTWTRSGGVVNLVTTDVDTSTVFAVSGDDIVWSSRSSGQPYRWSPSGGVQSVPVTGVYWVDSVAISGDRVGFTASLSGGSQPREVFAYRLGELTAQRITWDSAVNSHLQVYGERFAWLATTGSITNVRTWTQAGGLVNVTSDATAKDDIALSGDTLAWSQGQAPDREIFTSAGGAAPQQLTDNALDDYDLNADSGRLAWFSQSAGGRALYTWTPEAGPTPLGDPGVARTPSLAQDLLAWPDVNGHVFYALQQSSATLDFDAEHDKVWLSGWTPNSTVTVSIDQAGSRRFSHSFPTDGSGNATSAYGDDVTTGIVMASDGHSVKRLEIDGSFYVTNSDANSNSVRGKASPMSLVELAMGGDGWQDSTSANADNNGDWTAFFLTHDMQWGEGGAAWVSDLDGDAVRFDWRATRPTIAFSPTSEEAWLDSWPPQVDVEILANQSPDPAGAALVGTVRTDADGNAYRNGLSLPVGTTYVHARFGTTDKSLALRENLQVTEADPGTDVVAGTGPGGEVRVRVWTDGTPQRTTFVASGPWSVNFGGLSDLLPGMDGRADLMDGDGDAQSTSWHVNNPRVWGDIGRQSGGLDEWTANSYVDVALDADGDPLTTGDQEWRTTLQVGPQGSVGFDAQTLSGHVLAPFKYLIAYGPGVTKVLRIADIQVTGISEAANTVSGTISEQGVISLWEENTEPVEAAIQPNGSWVADLTERVDVVLGSSGQMEYTDPDGDGTQKSWHLAKPRIYGDLVSNQIHLEDWVAGEQVQVMIDSSSNPAGGGTIWNGAFTAGSDGWVHIQPSQTDNTQLVAGQYITVQAPSGSMQLQLADLTIVDVDRDSDVVTGQMSTTTGGELHGWTSGREDDSHRNLGTQTAPYFFVFDFAPVGGIQYGDTGEIELHDLYGNATRIFWDSRSPRVWANPGDDTIGVDDLWPGVALITVDGDGNPATPDVLFEHEVPVDGEGRGELDMHAFGTQLLDPGMYVTLTQADTTKVLQVLDLRAPYAEAMTDEVTGTASQDGEVQVWIDGTVGTRTATVTGGAWTVNLSTLGSGINPGDRGHAEMTDSDGDGTRAGWVAPDPKVWGDMAWNWIGIDTWRPGTAVHLTVDDDTDAGNGVLASRDVVADDQGYATVYELGENVKLRPGIFITATGGIVTKTLQLQPLQITHVDLEANTVSGTASPLTWVKIWVGKWDGSGGATTSDASGNWTASFSDGHDIVLGDAIGAARLDGDWDESHYSWSILPPNIWVDSGTDIVEGAGFGPDHALTVTVDDDDNPANGTLYTWTGTADGNGAVKTDSSFTYDVVSGQYVRVASDEGSRDLLISDIRVTSVDVTGDKVYGTAAPGRDVRVIVQPTGVQRWATPDAGGNWTADFSAPQGSDGIVDLTLTMTGYVHDRDVDFDSNITYFTGDMTPPVTTSNARETYWRQASVTLSATDTGGVGVAHTYYRLNGSANWTEGSVVGISQPGDYTLQYYSIDVVGNAEAAKTTTLQVQAPIRKEENDPLIRRTGAWTTVVAKGPSGGSHIRVNSAASLAIGFHGTGVDLIAMTTSYYGIAAVSVDDGPPVDVDLYSATPLYQQVVWSVNDLPDGDHTVRISWTGKRNPSSTGRTVAFDAVDVSGSLSQPLIRYEQTETALLKSGSWATYLASGLSGGSHIRASSAATIEIGFHGTRLDLISMTASYYGIASVSIDGGPSVDVDMYSDTTQYQRVVWSRSGLPDADHTLRIAWSGRRNSASTGRTISLDAVAVNGTLRYPLRLEETQALLRSGPWATYYAAALSGGSHIRVNSPASLRVAFHGTDFDLLSMTANYYGIASVSLDGQPPVDVDLYSATATYQQVVWTARDLPDGDHFVDVVWTGRKNAASTGRTIAVDGADVFE